MSGTISVTKKESGETVLDEKFELEPDTEDGDMQVVEGVGKGGTAYLIMISVTPDKSSQFTWQPGKSGALGAEIRISDEITFMEHVR
nr:hypothetical protein [Haloferax larsenii]